MTHGVYPLASGARVLTEGYACYSIYHCADGRMVTVAALEPKFFRRLCELVGAPELADRQYDADQVSVREALTAAFAARDLADWLALFEGEDVCVGPVATRAEAREFAPTSSAPAPALGAHTGLWREELGV
jgi:crotonobetainyl-CoA:carnitine CoA-transferase CaiB-like acyl-CoA transferase